MQVKRFARTQVLVGNQEVLAIVLEDLASALTHSCATIKKAVEKAKWGVSTQKDFLRHDAVEAAISRGKTAHKRRCLAVYLTKMPIELEEQFVASKLIHGFDEAYV